MTSVCNIRAIRDLKMPYISQMKRLMHFSGSKGRARAHFASAVAQNQPKEVPPSFTVTTPLYYVNACTYNSYEAQTCMMQMYVV